MPYTPVAHFNGHQGPVYALAKGTAHGTFLSAAGDHRIVQWHIDRPAEGLLIADAGQAAFSLLHIGTMLLIGDEHGGLHLVDLARKHEVRLEHVHRKGIFAFARLPDGRIAAAGGDGTLSLWDVSATSLALLRRIPLCEEKVRGLALHTDGSRLAVACGDGTIRILDTTDLNELHTVQAHATGVTSVAWHPHKPALISGGKDGHLRAWRSDRAFASLLDLPAHTGSIYSIAFDEEGRHMATASRDKTAKVWDARTFDALARLDRAAHGHTHSVNALCWTGGMLLTAGDDKRAIAWAVPEDVV